MLLILRVSNHIDWNALYKLFEALKAIEIRKVDFLRFINLYYIIINHIFPDFLWSFQQYLPIIFFWTCVEIGRDSVIALKPDRPIWSFFFGGDFDLVFPLEVEIECWEIIVNFSTLARIIRRLFFWAFRCGFRTMTFRISTHWF